MRAKLGLAVGALALLTIAPAGRGFAADIPGIAIITPDGTTATMTTDDLAKLPAITLPVGFATEHGPRQAVFEGPLLWTVLDQAHAIAKGGPVRHVVGITGQDGYTATLALGEVSPDFEGKQVIVAERMDGKQLDHPRLVVPGDKKGGRSVHDVIRIAVMPLPAAH
ncbi:hypothetical protein [Acidisphaera sp. L21]|uniref:hypothetical protein n=1 Tax=Acidisphaera sp. L21 TaxID=1641851 RepID=UPI00131C402A|nr:hypothetical protein [Acidisphaera sp. L21]